MGVASLVLGIVSAVFGLIPFCGTFALIPAIVGLVLGIVDLVKQKKVNGPKGKSVAGIICSVIAIVMILAYYFIFVFFAKTTASGIIDLANETANELNSSYNSSYNYDFDDYDFDNYDFNF